jgi:hypothetical protein
MRRIESWLLAVILSAMAGGTLAQSDPKLQADVRSELSPDSATLSRELFVGRAAWRIKLKNGAANELNRTVFTARTVVVDSSGNPVNAIAAIDGAVGAGNVIQVGSVSPHCALTSADGLTCSIGTLPSQAQVEFVVVAKTPLAGDRLKLAWSFGGDEGNGGGNGCCTRFDETTYTALIDAQAANSTVKNHVQSFMVSSVLNKAFTGVTALPTAADPWKTTADTGNVYTVNGVPQSYTQLLIDEQVNPSSLGSCSALQNNQCWVSQVSIPNTKWTAAHPLKITLDRHSSSIKNGSKLSNYVIQYKADTATAYTNLLQCTATNPSGPTTGTPCLDGACVEIPLATSPPSYVWRCNVKAIENGGYKVQ